MYEHVGEKIDTIFEKSLAWNITTWRKIVFFKRHFLNKRSIFKRENAIVTGPIKSLSFDTLLVKVGWLREAKRDIRIKGKFVFILT